MGTVFALGPRAPSPRFLNPSRSYPSPSAPR
jgi:hypothetical protein